MENLNLLQSFRHISKKTFGIAGIISSGFGFFADVLQPIAPFATYVFIIASILVVVGLSIQIFFKKNTLSLTVFFGFTAITTGLLTTLKTTAPQKENGIFANLVPAIADIQKDLNLVKKTTNEIKKTTNEIKKTTEQIEVKTDKIITSIENISQNKGVITNPKSPEDFYHNARFQEISGDYMAARQSYLRYLNTSSDKLDPHLRLITFLKIQEGATGARESYNEIASRSPTTITQYTKILLQDRSKRVTGLQQFAEENPDFGPVWYHLSQQFSEKALGTQTITDKKSELKFSTAFQAAVDAGQVTKYFVDQSLLSDWIKDVDSRIKAIQSSSAAKQLENPVTLTWSKSNSGWTCIINVSEYAEDIFWQIKGSNQPPKKTRSFSDVKSDVMTTRMMQLPNNQKPSEFLITYTDRSGNLSGPHEFLFEPLLESQKNARNNTEIIQNSWVSLTPINSKQLNINFTLLLTYRVALTEIKYGINKELPDTLLEFPPSTEVFAPVAGELYEKSSFTLPTDTNYVTVQVIYFNGEKSDIVKFEAP